MTKRYKHIPTIFRTPRTKLREKHERNPGTRHGLSFGEELGKFVETMLPPLMERLREQSAKYVSGASKTQDGELDREPPKTEQTEEEALKVLRLKVGVSSDSIKKAHRNMVKIYHPDKNKSPEATKKTQEINQAYQTLKRLGKVQ